MASGGKRTGTPGVAHGQRVDLNEPPSGEQYGDKAAMEARIAAVPMAPPAQPRQIVPPAPFDRPTERESEPLTSGLDVGPGPGSEALGMTDTAGAELRAIYRATGDEAIRELIEALEEEEGW